jgi:hypothetical protein
VPTSPRSDDPAGERDDERDGGPEPYLALAREIHDEVARLVADDDVDVDAMADAIARFPDAARARLVAEAFGRLPAERQWAVIERAFGDGDIRDHLAAERAARLAEARREAGWVGLAHAARDAGRLDTATLPAGTPVTLGLFPEHDVRAALPRGVRSTACARQLGLRVEEPGVLRVIDDVFNPRAGYFVTREYDEQTWRTLDRLPAHALVRLGSAAGVDAGGGASFFEPVLYPAARVDVEVGERISPGRLHLGFAMLGTRDVFAG